MDLCASPSCRGRVEFGELITSLVLSVVAVSLMWWLASSQGAVGIARADDWSYLLTQFEWIRTGDFVLNNWAVTMLIGQTVAAWPITWLAGESIVWHQAFVALFAVVGLWITYLLLRRYLTRPWSTLSVASLALGPLFAPSAISFMTDVPAFALVSASLFAGAVALDKNNMSWPWFLGSLLLSLLAFTFRDYAIVAGVTIVCVALIQKRHSRAAIAALLGVGGALICVASALYLWRHSLPNDLKLQGWDFGYSLELLGRASLTAALLISPVLVCVDFRPVIRTLIRTKKIATFGLLLWLVLVGLSGLQFLGNVVHPFGTSWLVSGPGVRIWPLWMNRTLISLSGIFLLALLAFVGATASQWWRAKPTLEARVRGLRDWVTNQSGLSVILFFPALLFMAHTFATIIFGTWWIDRYFILWVPFACAGLSVLSLRLHWNNFAPHAADSELKVKRVAAFAWIGIYLVLSFHIVQFDALVDGTKWRVAENTARESGINLSEVDGGMPFVAFYEPGIGIGAQDVPTNAGQPWWTARYPNRTFCRTVAFSPERKSIPENAEELTPFRSTFGAGGFVYVVPGPDTCDH